MFVECVKKGYPLQNEEILFVYERMGQDLVRDCSRVRSFNDQLRVVVVMNDVDILVTFYCLTYNITIENESEGYEQLLTCKRD